MIELFGHQDDFLYSTFRHTGLVGGYGSGKSFAGILKTVSKKLLYPGVNCAYYMPTYPLIKDLAFPRFKEVLTKQGIPYTLNETDKKFTTPFGNIILRSMDNPEMIVAYEVGYSLIDEADILPTDKMKTVFLKVLGRNRAILPEGELRQLDFVGTPEGFKFLYDFFVTNSKGSRNLIRAKTSDNKTVDQEYLDSMLESYTPEQIEAYMNGEFVNLTSGIVYRNYDRNENRSVEEINPSDVLHIGMDFNITNMSAIIHVVRHGIPHAVEEIMNAFDTSEIIEIIKERYKGYSIVVYPDASGKNRKTSGGSDIRLLKMAGFRVKSLKRNPFVRDRVNQMNFAFLTPKGERNYFVNDANCPNYSSALEQQTYTKNGEPDKANGHDHATDAGGYFIYSYTKPMKTAKARAR